jgi:hypothetical protein
MPAGSISEFLFGYSALSYMGIVILFEAAVQQQPRIIPTDKIRTSTMP